MNALQTLQIGKETEVRTMDAGETFLFEFKDGSVFVLSFESALFHFPDIVISDLQLQ